MGHGKRVMQGTGNGTGGWGQGSVNSITRGEDVFALVCKGLHDVDSDRFKRRLWTKVGCEVFFPRFSRDS